MAKSSSEPFQVVSSAGTGVYYTFKRKRGKTKLAVRKYDPVARKHVLFEEKKISGLPRKFNREKFLGTLGAAEVKAAEAKSEGKSAKAAKPAKAEKKAS